MVLKGRERTVEILFFVIIAGILIFFQAKSIFGGDGGDLVGAICVNGVAHPPGYPLYTILGRLLFKIPLFTPAWRVSLLSSLPTVGSSLLLFLIIKNLTKSNFIGFLTSLIMVFNYPIWLYSVVPEVFSLNNFFLLFLTYLTFLIIKKNDIKKLFFLFFIAGLSLTHHHFSLWFYPLFFLFSFYFHKDYWLLKNMKKNFKYFFLFLLFFLIGLLPYSYVPLTAKNYPPISWDGATNWHNFWHLFFRKDYGTFLSHEGAIKTGIRERLFLVWGFFLSLKEYFGWVGIFLLGLGIIFLFKSNKKIFLFLISLFIWELFFLFYSGFLLNPKEVFSVGIYLRFLLPGIIFSSIFIGIGLFSLNKEINNFFLKKFKFQFLNKKIISFLIFLIFFLYPFSLFVKNFKIFYHLRSDFTAEEFAFDILNTPPSDGILLLSFDNPLFNTQYVHYCLKEKPEVNILHLSLFEKEFFYPNLKKNYPNFNWPEKGEEGFLEKFLEKNYFEGKIYTNNISYFKKGAFIPIGLLYLYYPSKDKIPDLDKVYYLNKEIWSKYHDPKKGILSFFQPSTLASILNEYNKSAKNLAILFFEGNKKKEAKEFFEKAIYFNSKDFESYIYLGRIFMEEKNCVLAEENFLKAKKVYSKSSLPYFYLSENAKECFRDSKKTEEFYRLYLENKKLEEGSISTF